MGFVGRLDIGTDATVPEQVDWAFRQALIKPAGVSDSTAAGMPRALCMAGVISIDFRRARKHSAAIEISAGS